jgi:hypothetical protein
MLTFENVLSPILFAEYDAYYACITLRLKMLTDWPECNPLDWEKDLQVHLPIYFLLNSKHKETVISDKSYFLSLFKLIKNFVLYRLFFHWLKTRWARDSLIKL